MKTVKLLEGELKRCPFCGGEAFLHEDSLWTRYWKSYGVICSLCTASAPGDWKDTGNEAVAQWNQRYPIQ